MKRNMAVITAFIIGISYFSSDMVVKASQKEEGNFFHIENEIHGEIEEEFPEPVSDEGDKDLHINSLKKKPVTPELENLQMPQKLEVVIDPWNMDGKGQIYSNEYVIRNTGENTGILKLSNLVCRPREQSGVTIKTEKSGIHDNGEKSVYMEMVFGSEDRVVLSEDGSEYTAELKPGEELSVSFTGEVNENASEEWQNEEVTVGVVYSWDMKETEDTNIGQSEDAASEALGEEQEEAESSEEEGAKKDNPVPDAGERTEAEADEAEEITIEDMDAPQERTVRFDSWTIDENGHMSSGQYVIQNTGENTGRFRLSDLTCRIGFKEQKEIPVRTVWEEMDAQEGPCICIEMVSEDRGKPLLSQENQEKSGFEMELEPGEKVIFHFTGERKGIRIDDLKTEELELIGVILWNTEEEIS